MPIENRPWAGLSCVMTYILATNAVCGIKPVQCLVLCNAGGLLDVSSGELDDFEDVSPTYGAVVAGMYTSNTNTNTN